MTFRESFTAIAVVALVGSTIVGSIAVAEFSPKDPVPVVTCSDTVISRATGDDGRYECHPKARGEWIPANGGSMFCHCHDVPDTDGGAP